MKNKQNAQRTMFIDCTGGKNLRTLIHNILDFEIIEEKEYIQLKLPISHNQIPKETTSIVLTYSADPSMDYAADWTQLGHTRLRVIFSNFERIEGEHFTIRVNTKKEKTRTGNRYKNFEYQELLPERSYRWKDANPEFKLC